MLGPPLPLLPRTFADAVAMAVVVGYVIIHLALSCLINGSPSTQSARSLIRLPATAGVSLWRTASEATPLCLPACLPDFGPRRGCELVPGLLSFPVSLLLREKRCSITKGSHRKPKHTCGKSLGVSKESSQTRKIFFISLICFIKTAYFFKVCVIIFFLL